MSARPAEGRPSKLNLADQQRLRRLLRKGARAQGWDTERWTSARIAQLIEKQFGVTYHPHSVPTLMHRVGWSPQLPQRVATERNDRSIQQWVTETWPTILERARERRAHLAFVDEAGVMLAASLRRTWAPIGETPKIRMHTRHGRVSVISAIVVSAHLKTLDLYFNHQQTNYKQPTVCAFLEQVLAEKHGPIVALLDQGNIHRGDPIRDLVRRHPRLSVEYFPSYSPDLNPDEGIWKLLKEQLANGRAEDLWHLELDAATWLVLFSFLPRLLLGCVTASGLSFENDLH